MSRFSLVIVLLLTACSSEPLPQSWPAALNPYMSELGYTMAPDGETILKNGYPVWVDPKCIGRGCPFNQPLVPKELVEVVRADLLTSTKKAQEKYISDLAAKLELKLDIDDRR
jgi:hypothetical protein